MKMNPPLALLLVSSKREGCRQEEPGGHAAVRPGLATTPAHHKTEQNKRHPRLWEAKASRRPPEFATRSFVKQTEKNAL